MALRYTRLLVLLAWLSLGLLPGFSRFSVGFAQAPPPPPPPPSPQAACTPSSTPDALFGQPTASVTYSAGWNLVGVPSGTTIPAAVGNLYTLDANSTNYISSPSGSQLTGGTGYWAYLTAPTTVNISNVTDRVITTTIPAQNYIMIGNPNSTGAIVSGMDCLYVFDPHFNGYQVSSFLLPGQGGWAFSLTGGTVTISLSEATSTQPPPPLPLRMTPPDPSMTSIDATDLEVDWTADTEVVSGYELDDGNSGTRIATFDANTYKYVLHGLSPNTEYCVVLYAYNSSGYSPPSDVVCAATPSS
jgi:hypothetical protein